MALPPLQLSASSSASSKGESAAGDIYGGSLNFSTGYFGTGTDTAGLIQKSQLPLMMLGLVVLVWLLKKKK